MDIGEPIDEVAVTDEMLGALSLPVWPPRIIPEWRAQPEDDLFNDGGYYVGQTAAVLKWRMRYWRGSWAYPAHRASVQSSCPPNVK